jgi:hypothetical protein
MPAAVLGRLLALLIGSALVDDSSVDVPDPDGVIVEALIEESRHWIGALGTVSENSVTVELSATSERWWLGQRLPKGIDRTAVYDVTLEVWLAAPPSTRGNRSNTQDLKGSAAPPPGGVTGRRNCRICEASAHQLRVDQGKIDGLIAADQ